MTIFSSRGPDSIAPDIIKPDITAPGLQIVAGNSPFPIPTALPGELFQAIAGTSMSSPHVAGIYALLKQAHPDWSAADGEVGPHDHGRHRTCATTTASASRRPVRHGRRPGPTGRRWGKGSSFNRVSSYDAVCSTTSAFTCGMKWEVFSAVDCDLLDSLGVPSAPTDLNLPSIGISEVAGSQTVTRTRARASRAATQGDVPGARVGTGGLQGQGVAIEDHAPGGQSATFTVTVTNMSAPIDAWRFGSLTWVSHDYKVRSPIAVKGALFDAPEEVAGTGTAGSVSIPVEFGYTGAYTAAAHGLVKATLTHANVKQDRDQTFAPGDVATGGANLHQFTLSNAALFRLAIPPDGTEANADLDVYVVGPHGEEFEQHGRWHRRAGRYPLPRQRRVEGLCARLVDARRRLRLRHVVVGDPRDARRRVAVDHVGAGVGDDRHGGHGRGELGGHHGRNGRGLVPGRGVAQRPDRRDGADLVNVDNRP